LRDEAEYYSRVARQKAENAAAKKLSAKLAERDKLVFSGDEGYKYRQAVKKIDKEIETLRAEFVKAGVSTPPLALSPAVKLTEDTLAKNFPAPPAAGQEYYFCTGQKADAFLKGKITWYFDRLYVEIALWSIYAGKVTYTDDAIFSPDSIKEGSIELGDRLFDYISGFLPAWIKVKADPDTAIILIDDYVAGMGETELMDFTPGTVSLTAFAEGHETFTMDVDLAEGNRTDVSISLSPVPVDEFEVRLKNDLPPSQQPSSSGAPEGTDSSASETADGNDSSAGETVDGNDSSAGETADGNDAADVYDGALYVGKTPIKLKGQSGQQKNINVETQDGRVDQTVFIVSKDPIVFDPKIPPAENRVEAARKKFYSAYGRFWIALPLAVLGIGLNNTITAAYNSTGDPELKQQRDAAYWGAMGLSIVMGACLAETFYRIGRYVWEANKEGSPLSPKPPEPEAAIPAGQGSVPVEPDPTTGTEVATDIPADQDAAPDFKHTTDND
jgi:hypothetical protein